MLVAQWYFKKWYYMIWKKKTSGEKEYKGSRYAEFGVGDDKNFKSKCWESIRVGIWRFLKERKNHMPAWPLDVQTLPTTKERQPLQVLTMTSMDCRNAWLSEQTCWIVKSSVLNVVLCLWSVLKFPFWQGSVWPGARSTCWPYGGCQTKHFGWHLEMVS